MSTIVRPPSGLLTTRTRRPRARRFAESRLASDTAAMAWRSWLTMLRTPAEFFDVLIQPVLFTVMFGELLGGAISGDVRSYLPILVPGLIMTNVLTTCQSVGVDLREDMDKGVFDRFRAMPMSRLAPLLGPMTTDLLRYGVCSALTLVTGVVMGYRPGGGWWGGLGAVVLATGCAWAISWLYPPAGHALPVDAGGHELQHDPPVPPVLSVQCDGAHRHPAALVEGLRRAQSGLLHGERPALRPGRDGRDGDRR